MNMPVLTLEVRLEADIVLARQRARQIAGLIHFPLLDQTRIATATSEMARNAFENAGGGKVEFLIQMNSPPGLLIRIRERGPGVRGMQSLLEGRSLAPSGIGPGVLDAKRLMDLFQIEASDDSGASISMFKALPKRITTLTSQDLADLSRELVKNAPQSHLEEIQQQNQELLRTLQELRESQAEIAQLHTRELEETNRGVVALYAELEENANALKRVSDLKSRFLSNMSHEFRSPLNTILSLSGFLLDRSDGDLTSEQEKQVRFIRRAAEGLTGLVNDLLDLAKVEAGKAVVRAQHFDIVDLFESLRGSTAPLIGAKPVSLIFEEPVGLSTLHTDEAKVSQILRNFLSNAVKFTERGEIRVFASSGPGDTVIFSVADTGIGIASSDRSRIFEEFGQVESPIQAQIKGTGLGLPLSRKLAELLGGTVSVRSELGVGSTFFAILPCHYQDGKEAKTELGRKSTDNQATVLVVEDDPMDMLLYEKCLEDSGFRVHPARNLAEARRFLRNVKPVALILDIVLEAENGWTLLTEIRHDERLQDLPVLVLTMVDGQDQALALGADEFRLKPIDQKWLLQKLASLEQKGKLESILIIDDEESYRYLLKELLSPQSPFVIIEASDGQEGLRKARELRPNVIFLDLMLGDMTGFEVLQHLKATPDTQDIPVIINTSKTLEEDELRRLAPGTAAFLPKRVESREDGYARVCEALVKVGLGSMALGKDPVHD